MHTVLLLDRLIDRVVDNGFQVNLCMTDYIGIGVWLRNKTVQQWCSPLILVLAMKFSNARVRGYCNYEMFLE